MAEYRAYIIGNNGHIASFRTFLCDSDADATVWAKQLVDGHGVELWSGDRFVTRLDSKPNAVSHEIKDGRMIVKPPK